MVLKILFCIFLINQMAESSLASSNVTSTDFQEQDLTTTEDNSTSMTYSMDNVTAPSHFKDISTSTKLNDNLRLPTTQVVTDQTSSGGPRTSLLLSNLMSIASGDLPTELSTTEATEQFSATPATNTLATTRRNKDDLYFCCADNNSQSLSGKPERERNTKPPPTRRSKKNPVPEEPYSERRPALLLRFFPDGTAVLISKFQVYLHVKPKQLTFEEKESDGILQDEKSYEITYKHLESLPTQLKDHVGVEYEDEDTGLKDQQDDHSDHEFVTTISPSSVAVSEPWSSLIPNTSPKMQLEPLLLTVPTEATKKDLQHNNDFETDFTTLHTLENFEEKNEKFTEEILPFFSSVQQMESLRDQYQPPLTLSKFSTEVEEDDSNKTSVSKMAKNLEIANYTTSSSVDTATEVKNLSESSSTMDSKCAIFRNRPSQPFPAEDSVDDSLLRRLPLLLSGCETTEDSLVTKPPSLLSEEFPTKVETTTEAATTAATTTTTTATTVSTTIRLEDHREQLPIPVAHQLKTPENFPANRNSRDVVVVTSIPMMIQIKSRSNQMVTAHPAWREVTVGVVRDHNGQPLKPPKATYNNWASHLRGLKKKNQLNKSWKDRKEEDVPFNHQREPVYLHPQRLQLPPNVQAPLATQISGPFRDHQPRAAHFDALRNGNALFHPGRDVATETSNRQLYFQAPSNSNSGLNKYEGSDRRNHFNRAGQISWSSNRSGPSSNQNNNINGSRNRPPYTHDSRANHENTENRPQQNWNLPNRWHGNRQW